MIRQSVNTHINRVRVDGIRAVVRHRDCDECAELLARFADLVNRGLLQEDRLFTCRQEMLGLILIKTIKV